MALSDAVKAAISRLRTFYEGTKPYNAATNPGGFQNDGHRVNFVPALQDVGAVVAAAGDLVDQAAAYAANSPKALRVDLDQDFAGSEIAQALINIGLLADTLPLNADQKSKILANLGAAAVLAAVVQKTGDTMSGDLTLEAPKGAGRSPNLTLLLDNVFGWKARTLPSARLQFCDYGETAEIISIGPGGDINTKQVGDLVSYINNVGANNQNAAVNRSVTSGRWVLAGQKGCFDQPGTGGFISPTGGHTMSCDYWTYQFVQGDGNLGCAPFAYRWRAFQIYIQNQGWVTCGAAS
jgi:hypothetical protein